MKDGPATNLRKTPGQIASRLTSDTDNSAKISELVDGEELKLLLDEVCNEKKLKKAKSRRPTGKRQDTQLSSQPTMKDFVVR